MVSLNIIPELQSVHTDPEWQQNLNSSVKDAYSKLRKVRAELLNIYQEEFLATLVAQAVDRKDRYRPTSHRVLREGDIVLIKEVNMKPNSYPLCIIKQIITNDNNEVTSAIVLKGKTRELVKRHSSTIIPLLVLNDSEPSDDITDAKEDSDNDLECIPKKTARKAAIIWEQKTRDLFMQESQ